MKIQMVSFDGSKIQSEYDITNSTLKEPKALDMYDINVFSLQNKDIWRYQQDSSHQLDCSKDFDSIKQMISLSTKSVNIIALPQNYSHR